MARPFQLSDREHNELVLRVAELVSQLEEHPDRDLAGRVQELLQSLDLVHREALHRLLGLIEQGAPQLIGRLLEDSAVQTLLLLYDFVPRPMEREEGRGRDGFVPLSELQVPVWVPAGRPQDFPEGELVARQVNQHDLLFCSLDGRLHVVDNRCLDSILPLQLGRLEEGVVICPWHGCRYRLADGRLEGSERRLQSYPTQLAADGVLRVGFNVAAPAAGDPP